MIRNNETVDIERSSLYNLYYTCIAVSIIGNDSKNGVTRKIGCYGKENIKTPMADICIVTLMPKVYQDLFITGL